MYSKLFEAIYLECNSGSGVSNDYDTYLESPLESNLSPPMLMEKIYSECNLKPLIEKVLREIEQETIIDDNGIDEYGKTRLNQLEDKNYRFFNNPHQSKDDFIQEIDEEVKLAKEREGKFNIIRVFDENKKDDTIGYITYYKDKNYAYIFNIGIF